MIVAAAPPQLRQPKPLPGETLALMIVRNHPHQWRNFLERMQTEFGLSPSERARLTREGPQHVADPRLREQIESFMNDRLPGSGRTLKGLSRLKKRLDDPLEAATANFQIVEVLWPRERDPSGSDAAERMAASLGARVLPFPTGGSKVLDLFNLLPEIRGEYVWVVPGCTKISGLTSLSLLRVKRAFDSRSGCGVYAIRAEAPSSTAYPPSKR